MICISIAILSVLVHEAAAVRTSAIVLEEALATEFGSLDEVEITINDSVSLGNSANDESARSEKHTSNTSREVHTQLGSNENGYKATQTTCEVEASKHDLADDVKILQEARLGGESIETPIGDNGDSSGWVNHLFGQTRNETVPAENLAAEYVKRFLLKDLCTEEEVMKSLFTKNDKDDVSRFLNEYRAWANERDWKILHEFSVHDDADVVIVGDLHGHFATMRAAFRVWLARLREKSNTHLVFLGDFVDRGSRDVETAIAIMALQMWMNGPVIVLRGNHENDKSSPDGRSWTFAQSLSKTFETKEINPLWDLFVQAFWKLPAAAIMTRDSQRYLMLHGGWTGRILRRSRIKLLKETPLSALSHPEHLNVWPEEGSPESLIEDLVWSDVIHRNIAESPHSGKYGPSRRGSGIYTYGYEAILDMLETLHIDWCISGHKHENLVWVPKELGFTKGHFVVVSANGLKGYDYVGNVVVVEKQKQKPPGLVCCCWTDEKKAKVPEESTCKYRFTQTKWCCKYKEGSDCAKHGLAAAGVKVGWVAHKYRKQSADVSLCGNRPHFEELPPSFISKYTLNAPITEGHWNS